MIEITNTIAISENEVELMATRAQGAGGQHVNKVSTAIHLKFNIPDSSLPDHYKEQLMKMKDRRITRDGVIVIKSQQFRSQEKNKEEALKRLSDMIRKAGIVPRKRRPTKPSRRAKAKRMDEKNKRGQTKSMRKKINY